MMTVKPGHQVATHLDLPTMPWAIRLATRSIPTLVLLQPPPPPRRLGAFQLSGKTWESQASRPAEVIMLLGNAECKGLFGFTMVHGHFT